jgi:hypothetical protein
MRRLADILVEVVTSSGIPIAGVPVSLRSTEFDRTVEDWIAGGRLAPGGSSTDPQGRYRVERVPSGEYEWSVKVPGAEPLEGTLFAGPGEETVYRIAVPD